MAIPTLSICIVNHRTPELTRACIESIVQTQGDLQLEVLVLNNTPDAWGPVQEIMAGHPEWVLIQNEEPHSFAVNQNKLLRRSRGRYLMPLNSDTVITAGALAALINFMDAHPRCAIAGPRLVHGDGSLQPSQRNFPTPLTHFLEASGLWQLLRSNRLIGRYYYLCDPHTRTQPTDWLTGACYIVRAEAARQTGYFDDQHFTGMYAEDLDWCWRIAQAGWEIWFDAAATVMHLESQSPLDDRSVQIYKGFYLFCALHYSRWMQRAMRFATIAALAPRRLLARDPVRRRIYADLMALPLQPSQM